MPELIQTSWNAKSAQRTDSACALPPWPGL